MAFKPWLGVALFAARLSKRVRAYRAHDKVYSRVTPLLRRQEPLADK